MDCTDCGERPDRPHLFFAHAPDTCPSCGSYVEARVVFRGSQVLHLTLCTGAAGAAGCGEHERVVSEDKDAYRAAFLARGQVPKDHDPKTPWLFKRTTSVCPECLKLLLVDVVIEDGKVYFQKSCAKDAGGCGTTSKALVSEDAAYYVKAYAYARAGTQPFSFGSEVKGGCPTDCGTCADHEQHTCLPIVEVTDHCNLECPICIVDNQYSTHMAPAVFRGIVDDLVKKEGRCESIAISGGEPTSHPQLLELVDIATRDEIGRVVVITNGLRLGKDEALAEALAKRGAYVGLQLDGFDAATHTKLRGRDLVEEKQAALAMIKRYQLPTQLIYVATRGANEHQIGQALELFLAEPHMLSLNFQPMAFTGHGGAKFGHDPLDRLTIPGVIAALASQSNGRLKREDFAPLPCSHPQCVSLTYLLKLDDGSYVPFSRFVDFEKNGTLLKSSATLPASPEVHDAMHEIIHDVYARQDEIERGPQILQALRRSLLAMFPDRKVSQKEAVRIGEGQAKSIFIHQYMDRHDFDLERLRKCCHHYPQPAVEGGVGKVMPACGFNMFHRGAAQGHGSPVPKWALAEGGVGTASARLLRVLQ